MAPIGRGGSWPPAPPVLCPAAHRRQSLRAATAGRTTATPRRRDPRRDPTRQLRSCRRAVAAAAIVHRRRARSRRASLGAAPPDPNPAGSLALARLVRRSLAELAHAAPRWGLRPQTPTQPARWRAPDVRLARSPGSLPPPPLAARAGP